MADGSLLPDYYVLSTATRPAGKKAGVTLMETDTGNEYTWSGSDWYQSGSSGSKKVRADSSAPDYEYVAASQTAQVCGTTGAAGDYIDTLTFSITASSGAKVTIYDNGVEIYSHAATTGATATGPGLRPYSLPLHVTSQNGAFTVTTQANVTALLTGDFT